MKRLIVNADDFGLTAGVNRGVEDACLSGNVRSVTLMAVGSALGDAVRIASSTLKDTSLPVSVGCHVVLMDGVPSLAPRAVQSLVQHGNNSEFRPSFSGFARGALSRSYSRRELVAEIRSQIERLQAAGLTISHADTHKHAHLFPGVMESFVEALKTSGIRALRNPFYPIGYPNFQELRRRPRLIRRLGQIPLLRSFARRFRTLVNAEGLITTDGCIGIYEPVFQSLSHLDQALATLRDGTWELVCHPGHVTPELDRINTFMRESREKELNILCSKQFRQLLDKHEVQLCSFWDLLAERKVPEAVSNRENVGVNRIGKQARVTGPAEWER